MSKPIKTYLLISFGFTWITIVLMWSLFKLGYISLSRLNIVYSLGALGPFLGALVSTSTHYQKPGIKKFFSTFGFKNLDRKTIVIAFSPLVFTVVALMLYPLLTGHWYNFQAAIQSAGLYAPIDYALWILPFFAYAFFEEFGWRGFLLPHLQEKQTAWYASLELALIWSCWHLPFFLWRFQLSGTMMIGFFFSMLIGSILLTSAFNFGRGSVVPAILFHFFNNLAAALDRQYIVIVTTSGFIILAYYVVLNFGKTNLSDIKRTQNIYLEKWHNENPG